MGRFRVKQRGKKLFKKGRRKFGKKRWYKNVISYQMNPKVDQRLKLPFPARYRTTLDLNVQGQIIAGKLGVTGLLVFGVKGNSLNLPVDSGLFTAWAPANFTIASAGGGLTTATIQPAGYHDIMKTSGAGLFAYSCVLASKINVTLQPTVSADCVSCVIVPVIHNSGSQYGSVLSAGSGPFSKGPKMCYGNNTGKDNTIRNYATTSDVFGVPARAVPIDETFRAIFGSDPAPPGGTAKAGLWDWDILVQDLNNSTNTAVINLDMRIKYYVEFQQSSMAGLTDN